jgi:hypothetical protein
MQFATFQITSISQIGPRLGKLSSGGKVAVHTWAPDGPLYIRLSGSLRPDFGESPLGVFPARSRSNFDEQPQAQASQNREYSHSRAVLDAQADREQDRNWQPSPMDSNGAFHRFTGLAAASAER